MTNELVSGEPDDASPDDRTFNVRVRSSTLSEDVDELERLRAVKRKVYDLLADLTGVNDSQMLRASEVVRALLIILDEEA